MALAAASQAIPYASFIIVIGLMQAIFVLWFLDRQRGRFITDPPLNYQTLSQAQRKRTTFWADFKRGAIIGFGLYVVIVATQLLMPASFQTDPNQMSDTLTILNTSNMMVLGINLVQTSIMEEIIFRELLPKSIKTKKTWSTLLCYLVAGLLFMGLHDLSTPESLYIYTILTLTFTVVRLGFHSLTVSAGTHIMYNLTTFLIFALANLQIL